ncbi:hypothetical protein E3T53_13330 [Cryobacterium psychrophilum]|uniref:Uncharacterized protein n=2 Tax=Cryobacterium psychrophilum TaxID=41988 RepID=A0A4Y8KKZ0_9MICO|nr:hypothetical protein E3T53_13330 [Cryobacterium psychrophilum]
MSGTGRAFLRIVVSLGIGLVVGALTYYVTAVVAALQISGNFTNNPLMLATVAIVGALAVAVGWRWPIVGLTAGIVIIAVVACAVTGRMGWSPSNGALNPYNAVAFGAMSVAPTIVGATMVAASALKLRSRRTR